MADFKAFKGLLCPRNHPTKLVIPMNAVRFPEAHQCDGCKMDINRLKLDGKAVKYIILYVANQVVPVLNGAVYV